MGKRKRIAALKKELSVGWPPSNPKAATARWHLVQEFAGLTGQRVQDVKKKLKKGEALEAAERREVRDE